MKNLLFMLAFLLLVSLPFGNQGWLQAQQVGDTVELSWTAPTESVDDQPLLELNGYRLYESATSGGPYTKIEDIAAGNVTHMLIGLTEGSHFYVLTAWNSGGESDYSNQVQVDVAGLIVRPKAPGSLAASW